MLRREDVLQIVYNLSKGKKEGCKFNEISKYCKNTKKCVLMTHLLHLKNGEKLENVKGCFVVVRKQEKTSHLNPNKQKKKRKIVRRRMDTPRFPLLRELSIALLNIDKCEQNVKRIVEFCKVDTYEKAAFGWIDFDKGKLKNEAEEVLNSYFCYPIHIFCDESTQYTYTILFEEAIRKLKIINVTFYPLFNLIYIVKSKPKFARKCKKTQNNKNIYLH